MKREPITMLQLRPDPWGLERAPLDQAPIFARDVLRIIQRNDVWEWIRESPMTEQQRHYLRWCLGVLARAKPVTRRLTWLERITGRLKP